MLRFRILHDALHEAMFAVIEASEGQIRRSSSSGPGRRSPATVGRWCAGKPGRRVPSPTPERPMDDPSDQLPDQTRALVEQRRASARLFARPLQRFLGIEAAGGIVLLVATVVALVWANSPWQAELRHRVPHRDRPVGREPCPERRCRPLDQRRPDDAVLLRRRHGDQARVGGRRAPRPRAPPPCRRSPRSAG